MSSTPTVWMFSGIGQNIKKHVWLTSFYKKLGADGKIKNTGSFYFLCQNN